MCGPRQRRPFNLLPPPLAGWGEEPPPNLAAHSCLHARASFSALTVSAQGNSQCPSPTFDSDGFEIH
eukprot:5271005-Pyramimonas_sp.AAC.1